MVDANPTSTLWRARGKTRRPLSSEGEGKTENIKRKKKKVRNDNIMYNLHYVTIL